MLQAVDTWYLGIALIPLAVYLLAIGAMNLMARSIVISGTKDTFALGLAISGLVIAGPMQLFLPTATAFRPPIYVWPLMIGLYAMGWTLFVLLQRPRLVIYNVSMEQLRPILASVISELDREARWAGDSLYLPSLGVQLHVEPAPLSRGIQLVSAGGVQSLEGWSQLEGALRPALSRQQSPRTLIGPLLIAAGTGLLIGVMLHAAVNAAKLSQALQEFLRFGK